MVYKTRNILITIVTNPVIHRGGGGGERIECIFRPESFPSSEDFIYFSQLHFFVVTMTKQKCMLIYGIMLMLHNCRPTSDYLNAFQSASRQQNAIHNSNN